MRRSWEILIVVAARSFLESLRELILALGDYAAVASGSWMELGISQRGPEPGHPTVRRTMNKQATS